MPLAIELVRGANAPGFIPAFDALMRHSFRDNLERIEIPVLIVWGRNDILVPVDDAEMYEHLIGENARSVIFDDTGHLPMLERPSRFNELLAGFIAGEREPERRRGGRQRVIAPSEALETSFAYLASTPLAAAGGGGS